MRVHEASGDRGSCAGLGGSYRRFGLTLVLTSACNLRCDYCYARTEVVRTMPWPVGERAIVRALNSLDADGVLELGFFGGEPLLEARLLLRLADFARVKSGITGHRLNMHLTTNGTVASEDAWRVMRADDIQVSVSCDGLPGVHDRHRCRPDGLGSSAAVLPLLRRLVDEGRNPAVIMVVRPDTLQSLPEGIVFLRDLGIGFVQPALDLWAEWSPSDLESLQPALAASADAWVRTCGQFGIGWFDDMAARLAGVPMGECSRCSFGAGEVAVTPSGHLYPCERLIGDDRPDHPSRLPGEVMTGADFLAYPPAPRRSLAACEDCAIRDACGTSCRCSNYVRTGDVTRPDWLLCRLNRMCYEEVTRVLTPRKKEEAPCMTTRTGTQCPPQPPKRRRISRIPSRNLAPPTCHATRSTRVCVKP